MLLQLGIITICQLIIIQLLHQVMERQLILNYLHIVLKRLMEQKQVERKMFLGRLQFLEIESPFLLLLGQVVKMLKFKLVLGLILRRLPVQRL